MNDAPAVIDASALLALIFGERLSVARGRFEDGIMSTVNLTEVLAKMVDTGVSDNALSRVKTSFPALLGAFADDDEVAIQDVVFDHRIARHLQDKNVTPPGEITKRNRFVVFHGLERPTSSNATR